MAESSIGFRAILFSDKYSLIWWDENTFANQADLHEQTVGYSVKFKVQSFTISWELMKIVLKINHCLIAFKTCKITS